MTAAESHRVNVLWNITFRRIFNCFYQESTSGLQFYCNSLRMNFIIDQHAILFYRRIMNNSNTILHAFCLLFQRPSLWLLMQDFLQGMPFIHRNNSEHIEKMLLMPSDGEKETW